MEKDPPPPLLVLRKGGVLTLDLGHSHPHPTPSALLDTILFPSETTTVK